MMKESEGTDTMKRIAGHVRKGAMAYLRQQYRVLGLPSFDAIPELLKLVGLHNTGKKKAKNFSLSDR